jgi:opacity protein-like surface antigen
MKKALIVAVLSTVVSSPVFAANPFDEFRNQLTGATVAVAQKNLDNFTKDLGGLMGGAAFHQGKTCGIPGFDVSLRASSKKISDDDAIVKAAGVDNAILPLLQAEIGLPANIDLIGRYSAYADSTLIGGGLRYGIINNAFPGLPSLSVQALYHALNVAAGDNKLSATSYNIMAMASFNLPVVDPYVGIGMDSTTVEPNASISLPKSGMKGNASTVRIEAGVNLGLLPFTYLQLGGTLIGSDIGYTAGLGVKF